MRLQTALKYSQRFIYKGERYITGAVCRKPKNKAYDIPVMKLCGEHKIIHLSSFCYVKPVIRITGVISK